MQPAFLGINQVSIPEEYTHLARFYGIPCYWDERSSTLEGRNPVWHWILERALGFHCFMWTLFGTLLLMLGAEPSFPVEIRISENPPPF